MNYHQFGQWVSPHLFPISYLRHVRVQKRFGFAYDLSELWTKIPQSLRKSSIPDFSSNSISPSKAGKKIIRQMLVAQKKNGSFGGYTTATLFSLIAFNHYHHFYNDLDSGINASVKKGMEYVDKIYFDSKESSYMGVTCDGRYWDSALIGQGLLEANMKKENLQPTADYLFGIQDKTSGGFGFGLDFEQAMDTDDTAEILLFMNKMKIRNDKTDLAIAWLFSMQNKDGGWGAFNKDNNGNFILKFATREFLDSADMFDESSADVTGHILEALGAFGYNIHNSKSVQKAVRYLAASQESEIAAWEGRWGVNYVYGTSASLIGLMSVGVSPDTNYVSDSVKWLMQCQNLEDGGYGEAFESYKDKSKNCQGVTTPSQTAWALMALLATGHGDSINASNAAKYLLKNYSNNGQFKDVGTFVGTGHPKIVPMQYPSYAPAFSMMALSRYKLFLSKQQKDAL
jgi:squalene-hopene/tetraprenyl-beta-curcumene cyclase